MRRTRELFLLATLVVLGGCRPTFAPPVRTAGFGVPGHLEGEQVEVSASGGLSGMSDALFHGSPVLTVAVADWVALEGGGDFFAERSLMGWGGVRVTPVNLDRGARKRLQKFGLDLAVGGGGGVGGSICNDGYPESDGLFDGCPSGESWDGVTWSERTAAGFYAEIGLGIRLGRRFGLVLRPNVQVTSADGIPMDDLVRPGLRNPYQNQQARQRSPDHELLRLTATHGTPPSSWRATWVSP